MLGPKLYRIFFIICFFFVFILLKIDFSDVIYPDYDCPSFYFPQFLPHLDLPPFCHSLEKEKASKE